MKVRILFGTFILCPDNSSFPLATFALVGRPLSAVEFQSAFRPRKDMANILPLPSLSPAVILSRTAGQVQSSIYPCSSAQGKRFIHYLLFIQKGLLWDNFDRFGRKNSEWGMRKKNTTGEEIVVCVTPLDEKHFDSRISTQSICKNTSCCSALANNISEACTKQDFRKQTSDNDIIEFNNVPSVNIFDVGGSDIFNPYRRVWCKPGPHMEIVVEFELNIYILRAFERNFGLLYIRNPKLSVFRTEYNKHTHAVCLCFLTRVGWLLHVYSIPCRKRGNSAELSFHALNGKTIWGGAIDWMRFASKRRDTITETGITIKRQNLP